MQANQAVTFRTDGGDDVRDLPLYLNPDSEHLLDWFHLTMRLTVMTNMAKSLRAAPPDEEGVPPPADPAAAVAEGLQRLSQVVLLARQRRARPEHDQRYGGRRRGRGPEPRAGQVREDPARVRHLHPSQRRLHPQLRRALPCRRSHLQLDSGVRR